GHVVQPGGGRGDQLRGQRAGGGERECADPEEVSEVSMRETYLPAGLPLPAADASTCDAPFWEACRRHELVVQRCSQCGTYRHTPEAVCWQCQSFAGEWARVSGKGVVYSYVEVVYPTHPALRERVPYNVVVVELEEAGVRMVGNLVDTAYEDIRIGMPV